MNKIFDPPVVPPSADFPALVAEALSAVTGPAIAAYDLGRLAYQKCRSRQAEISKGAYESVVESLVSVRLLTRIEATGGYLLFGHSSATSAEIACCLDPFAFLSHLSAMEYHGLTDRFPQLLYLIRPTAAEWRKQAESRMERDLANDLASYRLSGFPRLTRPKFAKLGSTTIHFQERSQLGAFRNVSGSPLRVATIGRTFLDMLREPKLCGGIQHVLDIYRREAKRNLRLIVDEVDRHGAGIDKVRAGYVLTELCQLEFDAAATWRASAQRGGSRKLDPDAEFSSTYSEQWKLSLNVPWIATVTHDQDDA